MRNKARCATVDASVSHGDHRSSRVRHRAPRATREGIRSRAAAAWGLALALLFGCDTSPAADQPRAEADLVEGVCEVREADPRSCDDVCAVFDKACAGVVAVAVYEPNHPQGWCADGIGLELGEDYCGANPPAPPEFNGEAAAWECYCHAD